MEDVGAIAFGIEVPERGVCRELVGPQKGRPREARPLADLGLDQLVESRPLTRSATSASTT